MRLQSLRNSISQSPVTVNEFLKSNFNYAKKMYQDLTLDQVRTKVNQTKEVIRHFATEKFVQIGICTFCLYAKSNLFVIGFVVGFVLEKDVKNISERINNVFATRKTKMEKIELYGVCSLVAIFALPTTVVLTTLYQSAQWGAKISREAQERSEQQQANEGENSSPVNDGQNPDQLSDQHNLPESNQLPKPIRSKRIVLKINPNNKRYYRFLRLQFY